MTQPPTTVEIRIQLSQQRAILLRRLAEQRGLTEDQVVAQALDILFVLSGFLGEDAEREGWSLLSTASLQRTWDNEADAAYDDWRNP
jgi:hypothetical protein